MTTNGKLKSLIQAGSDLVGAGIGGALGFAAGGPATAAGASAAGVVVSRVLGDVANRALSAREATRVGATAAFAAQIIDERLEDGQKLRADGFFGEDAPNERSPAAEIFEGTLLAARGTHEEKKLQYLGALFANIAFLEDCPPAEANFLIQNAESFTYAQYVLLHLFSLTGNPFGLRQVEYRFGEDNPHATRSSLSAIYALALANLITMRIDGKPYGTTIAASNIIIPGYVVLIGYGPRFHQLLGLKSITQEDMESVAKWLR